MSEALNLIYDTLDVFSGKKPDMKEEQPGLVDVMSAARTREKAKCRKDCWFPSWVGGCPYLFVNGESCEYYGPNYENENG
jgi:hypothetical protein